MCLLKKNLNRGVFIFVVYTLELTVNGPRVCRCAIHYPNPHMHISFPNRKLAENSLSRTKREHLLEHLFTLYFQGSALLLDRRRNGRESRVLAQLLANNTTHIAAKCERFPLTIIDS